LNPYRSVAVIAWLLALLPSCAGQFEGGTYKPMQEDFDRIRLDHLFVITKLIDEYQLKAGRLPFEKSADGKPVAVIIASEGQLDRNQGQGLVRLDLKTRASDGIVPEAPKRIEMRTVNEFVEELKAVLEREIDLPVDPQRVPVNKPCVYVFTSYLDVFDVSAYLHNSLPFARKMGDFNNKITIGSRSYPESGIWTADELMQQPEFRKFFGAPFNRSGYRLQTKIPEK
jgi:hypothetical protein